MTDDLGQLIGKTLPDAEILCSGTRLLKKECNGRFAPANGTERIVRARRTTEGIEVVVSKFLEEPVDDGEA